MKIVVYGPGCPNCKVAEKIVRDAVAKAGVEAEISKVEDYVAMAAAGILGTPAVSVDGVVRVAGRVPRPEEVSAWLVR
jgi:small redox-active disulfide protein 2